MFAINDVLKYLSYVVMTSIMRGEEWVGSGASILRYGPKTSKNVCQEYIIFFYSFTINSIIKRSTSQLRLK